MYAYKRKNSHGRGDLMGDPRGKKGLMWGDEYIGL